MGACRSYGALVLRRVARRLVLAPALFGVVHVVVPVVSLASDEAAVPAVSDAPQLPQGVTVAHEDVLCGSGGCWRELTLHGSSRPSAEQPAAGLEVKPGQEICAARNLVDRRRVCTGVSELAEGAGLHLRFDRSW